MFRLTYLVMFVLTGCFGGQNTLDETDLNTQPSIKTQSSATQSIQAQTSIITMSATDTVNHGELTVRIIKIEDSRCPIGTACVWAGQMVVTLDIVNELQEKKEITLIHKREPELAEAFGFNFLLQTIEPHPKEGKVIQLSDQIVTLHIMKVM